MSRLKDMYQRAKKPAKTIVDCTMLVGAVGLIGGLIGNHIYNMGEVVYRGNLNGQEVVYEEGLAHPNRGKNRMTIEIGDKNYILEDITEETGVKFPDFANQELEKIVIKTPQTKRVYKAETNYDEILDEQHTKAVFERGNRLYNDLRAKIRAEIESRYKATEEQIPQ